MTEENKEYDISIKNRLVLSSILPKEANFVTIRLISNLKLKLELTKKEIEDSKIIALPSGGLKFEDMEAIEQTKKISIDNILVDIIQRKLKELDKEQKIHSDVIEIYEMFV